nr:CPBP family intramembrane glutamic endopeptidase [Paenibacillus oenotherae]
MQLSWVRNNTDELRRYVTDFGNADYFIYVLLGVGFFAVVFEELLFRGIVFTSLRKIMPAWAAVILGSIVYGYFQPSPWVGFIAFFLSILYCLVYMRLQSIWGSIAIGAVVNCFITSSNKWGMHDAMMNFSNDVLLMIGLLSLSIIGLSLVYLWQGAAGVKKHAKTLGMVVMIVAVYFGFLQVLVIIWENVVLKQYPDLAPHGIIGLYTNALLSLPLFYFIYKWFFKKNLITITGFRNVSLKVHVMNIILAVCMAVWVMTLFNIPQVKEAAPGFEGIVGFFLGQSAAVFFSFFLINSLYKEFLFRALLFNEIRKSLPLWAAMIVTGILYGIMFSFSDIPTKLYGTAGAVIFGLLYVWYRSIWVTYVNELVLFSTYYVIRHYVGVPEGATMYVAQGVSSIAILALMYGLWKGRQPAVQSNRTEKKLDIGA